MVAFSRSSSFDARPFGNRLAFGAVLGVNLLGDYDSKSFTSTRIGVDGPVPETFSQRSGPHSFLVGPAVELRVKDGWSVEADAVYRPVRGYFTTAGTLFGQTYSSSYESSFSTWQFPVLAKYKLPLALLGDALKPFVEAGPSFRVVGSTTHVGFTAGPGVSMRLGPLNVAPAIRYTRWQADPFGGVRADEANLLVGITF